MVFSQRGYGGQSEECWRWRWGRGRGSEDRTRVRKRGLGLGGAKGDVFDPVYYVQGILYTVGHSHTKSEGLCIVVVGMVYWWESERGKEREREDIRGWIGLSAFRREGVRLLSRLSLLGWESWITRTSCCKQAYENFERGRVREIDCICKNV